MIPAAPSLLFWVRAEPGFDCNGWLNFDIVSFSASR